MLVYYFVPFIISTRYFLFRDSNGHNSVTVQNRTHVYMNFFDHKDLGNQPLQLCPNVVKHPVCQFETADGHLYLVIDLIGDKREVSESRLGTPCTDYCCFLFRLASLRT